MNREFLKIDCETIMNNVGPGVPAEKLYETFMGTYNKKQFYEILRSLKENNMLCLTSNKGEIYCMPTKNREITDEVVASFYEKLAALEEGVTA